MPAGSTVRVRAARRGDEPALLGLASDFATSFAVDPELFGRHLDALLDDDRSALLVAELDDAGDRDIVGYVAVSVRTTLYANGPVGWIEELMVEPTLRRSGAGTELVAAAETWALRRGAAMVSLATRRAADFWRAVGYVESAAYFRKVL